MPYEFLPDAQEILEEIVPVSFKVGCSSASSTRPSASRSRGWWPCGGPPRTPTTCQVLTRQYNRARQSQITRELADIVGAAAALS